MHLGRTCRWLGVTLQAAGAVLAAWGAAPSAAQDLAGAYVAGPTRFRVAIESWGPDCGARPASSVRPGEGRVEVEARGDHLSFAAPVGLRTDACWSENRALRRVSTTHRDGTWVTRCRTASNDPRAEAGTYTLRAASPERLERTAESRYNWQLNESRCVATLTETQTFQRLGGAPAAAAGSAAPAANCRPGAAARVRLRPETRSVEPGGSVCFRAEVVDAAGCVVPGAAVEWRLDKPEGLSGALRGRCFYAGASAADAEGTFQVVAQSGALAGGATVVVRTADLSDLRAQRIHAGSEAAGRLESARAEEAARLAARTGAGSWRQRAFWIAALAGVALLALAAAAAWVLLRSRREAAAWGAAAAPAHPTVPAPAPPMSDPAPDAPRERSSGPPGGAQHRICPICRRGYPEGTELCPTDAVLLLDYQAFVHRHREELEDLGRRRVCPQCGTTYDAETRFCGRDGTTLVDFK